MTATFDRDRHRPTDPAALACEIRRLYAGGLSARDIASCTRTSITDVLDSLRPIFNSNTGHRPER